MTEPNPKTSATQPASVRSPLPPDKALSWFPVLLAQVSKLHQAGRLHGAIAAAGITLDASGRPLLGPPAESVVLRGDMPESYLPELPPGRAWNLPTDLAAARAQLVAAGVAVDPRRIDVYQLGQLLCSIVSRQPASVYLRSAKARGLVPAAIRPLIDRALGHDKETRIANCDELTALVAQAAKPAAERNVETPAQGVAKSPETPRPAQPAKSEVRPPASQVPVKQPSASPASSASAAGLPFSRLGAYEIIERIGGGGMGDVYKAHDEALDRIVAVKVLPMELARQADFVRRFRAEAMAIAKLTHPNIVQVFAFGEDAGRHFFAMQFVNGESLAQVLRRRGRLSLDEALPLFQQCLAGLGAAHQRDLIHRDIKPGNILIDREHHRALVADFGLVKTADSGENMTATGVIMGTVDYLSPEQARGQHVDGRSDLYSLGALMYQTLAGRLPFSADTPTGMIFQHAFEQPKPLCEVAPDVPEPVGAIVMRLLAKDPVQRFATAKDVSAAIQAFRAGKPVVAPAVGPSQAANAGKPQAAAVGRVPVASVSVVGLPPLSMDRQDVGWRERLRDLWRAHAPAAIQGMQNTQQQVDGAVEEYQRRRDELSALARDAASVAADFANQATSHRKAAAAAAQRAAKTKDANLAAQARAEQAKCEQVAADFESQLSEQQEHSEEIQLRLSKVNATLQKLRSQRDALQARLRLAQQRLAAEGAGPVRPRRNWLIAAAGAGGLLVLLLGIWIVIRDKEGVEVAAIEVPPGARVEVSNSGNATATPAKAPSASLSARDAAEWILTVGGSVRLFVGGNKGDEIKEVSKLPSGALSLANVNLYNRKTVVDSDLARLKGLTTLVDLNLLGTDVTDAGLESLKGLTNLESLDLSATRVTGTGMKGLNALSHLTDFTLVGVPVTDQSLVNFPQYENLRHLNVYRVKLKKLDFVRGLKKLEGLNIGDTQVRDLAPLADKVHLESLNLWKTDVRDSDLVHLKSLAKLKYLNLHETAIMDAGLVAIEGLTRLENVLLNKTGVTAAGVAKLKLALPKCKIEWDGAPFASAPSLIGRVKFENQDAGVIVKCADGRFLTGKSIQEALQPRFSDTSPEKKTVVTLNGTLRVPKDMAVAVWHKGGSSNGGVHYLTVDNRELGTVGDDRSKDSYYAVHLKAGDHAVTWRLTGGDLGGTNLLKFIDRQTEEPLQLFTTDADAASAQAGSTIATIDNFANPLEPGFAIPMADLEVAEWAVSVGGNVGVRVNGRPTPPIAAAAELPADFQLLDLDLAGAKIHDSDLSRLTELRDLERLNLQNTPITGAGIRNLEHMTRLKALDLRSTGATAANVARLQAALQKTSPDCKIDSNAPTGLNPAPPADASLLMPGLLITEYSRLPVQDSGDGEFVALDKLGDPIDGPRAIRSLTKWSYNEARNAVAEGQLKIDVAGEYGFISNNFYDRNALYVNGVLVCGYRDGEHAVQTVKLDAGTVSIASVGYVVARGLMDVQWHPPGQSKMGKIPADRLFYTAGLSAQRTTESDKAAQKRLSQIPPAVPVDVSNVQPGLLELTYAQLLSQVKTDGNSMIAPPAEFVEPLGPPRVLGAITPWQIDSKVNSIAFGYLRVERGGEYGIYNNCGNNRGRIYVDGKVLFKLGDKEETVHRIQLKPGLVPITMVGYIESGRMIVQWQPPGQAELSPIPPAALWHDPAVMRPQF